MGNRIYVVIIWLLLFTLLPQSVFAQANLVTPTVYCLGNCPQDTITPTTLPGEASPTAGGPTPTGTTTPPADSTTPSPTVDPCVGNQTNSIQDDQPKKHIKHGGWIQRFIEFFIRLIMELLRLIGVPLPPLPGSPTPTPTGPVPSTTPGVSPTINPCPSPSGSEPSAVPSTGPSTAPTLTGSLPSPTTPVGAWCTNPIWQSSDPNGMWENGGYFVHNNMWNSSGDPQTTYACSYSNWYVTSTQRNDAGAVKTYPNSHKDYNKPLNSFTTITSNYQHETPAISNGIWNVAYDVWLNGLDIEVMIWTDNHNQQPSGSKVSTQTFGGRTWDVWKTSNNSYIAFVQQPAAKSGTVNIREMLNYLISQGWLSANVELYQIGYGVEVVSTNSTPATFKFTNFSITTN